MNETENKVTLNIELDAYEIAYLLAEDHYILADWNKSQQYSIINAVRKAINTTSEANKAKIAEVIRDGIYTDKKLGQYLIENNQLKEVEELKEPL